MSDILKKRIEKITEEVAELHPFLDELFRSIPDISSVSYTHGPNEKGADFLLSLKPGVLGQEELVGVLVKVGKISSNLTEVDRQVEECKERRFSQNGKKEVYLSEIWVVANGTISHRAQEKVWEKHKASKIKFIDLNKLADLASEYVPHFGMDMPTPVASYLKSQNVEAIKREGRMSLLPASQADMYLDQDIVEVDSGRSSPISKRRKVDIFKEIEEEKVLVVEAPMGGGKSKLLNVISKHYCKEDSFSETKTIPLYVHAKDVFSEGFPGVVEWVKKFKLDNGLDAIPGLNVLILVDGLDEVNSDESEFSDLFSGFISSVSNENGIKALFATRMISSEPLEAVVDRSCARYEIRPLSIIKIIEFISGICSEFSIQGRLFEDLKKSAIYKALPKTPISAIILATLIKEGASELPSSMTELYSQYCELSLGRWDADKGLGSIKEYEVATAVIEEIAEYFMDHEIPSISSNEAVGFFKRYLDARNLKLNPNEIMEKVLSRSDILVFDKKFGVISFKHRSFAEYYYARRKIHVSDREVNERIFHPYWSGSFFFYVGLRKDCPDLLSEIISLPVSHEGLRLSKLVNLSGFLLAGYKSPYDVVIQGIREIFIEAGNYYFDVSVKREDSVLSQFPVLHLLGLFRALMRESYSFEFFSKAINEVNEELATQPNKTESIAYSLYLLDIVRADLGIPKAFDRLIDVYDKTLPLPLQIAISDAVAKDQEHASPAMKKLEKKMRKAFRASSPLRNEVRRIAYESIDGKYDLAPFLAQKRPKKKA